MNHSLPVSFFSMRVKLEEPQSTSMRRQLPLLGLVCHGVQAQILKSLGNIHSTLTLERCRAHAAAQPFTGQHDVWSLRYTKFKNRANSCVSAQIQIKCKLLKSFNAKDVFFRLFYPLRMQALY